MSFGLARGRALDITGIGILARELPSFESGRIDPREWFDNEARNRSLHIEIGSGKGTFLVQQAPLTPDVNYLGIEWAGEFFRYAADRVRRHGISNVRVLQADASEFIRFWVKDAVCEVLHIYFPDPWPKKKHHKRRLIQDSMLDEFHRILTRNGEVRLVTDHDEYWSWMSERFARSVERFELLEFESPSTHGPGGPGEEIVGTNFERKYRREGRPFHAARLRKREEYPFQSNPLA